MHPGDGKHRHWYVHAIGAEDIVVAHRSGLPRNSATPFPRCELSIRLEGFRLIQDHDVFLDPRFHEPKKNCGPFSTRNFDVPSSLPSRYAAPEKTAAGAGEQDMQRLRRAQSTLRLDHLWRVPLQPMLWGAPFPGHPHYGVALAKISMQYNCVYTYFEY